MLRRAVECVLAAAALIALAPVLLVIAVAIRLDSPGPVIFTQVRTGRAGRPFRLYKFRSMATGRPGPPLTRRDDERVTRVGRLLRAWRLDELPQLWNVVRGEMALVGPRPELPSIVARYRPEDRQVLEVRPGLIGPTQLAWLDEAARCPPDADPLDHYLAHVLPEKLRSDLAYVRTRSLRTDAWCLLRAPFALVRSAVPAVRVRALARRAARLGLDGLAVGAANLLAFLLRFEGDVPARELPYLLHGIPVASAAYVLALLVSRTPRRAWQYFGLEDARRLASAALLGAGLHGLAVFLLGWRAYPRSAVVLTGILALLLLAGVRLLARGRSRAAAGAAPRDRRRAVIVGAGAATEALCRELRDDPARDCEVIGLVDDDARLTGEIVHDLPVLGTSADLSRIVRRHRVQQVIVATGPVSGQDFRRIARECAAAGVGLRALPSLTQLVRGDGEVRYLRQVEVRELLRREPLVVDEEPARAMLRGRRVMVTGAGGTIGAELCRRALDLGAASLVMVERAETALHEITLEVRSRFPGAAVTPALVDLVHGPRLAELFRRSRPQLVFHAAAYKHVPILEDHPVEAVLNNVAATRRLAALSHDHGTDVFVFVSTDKAANPTSLMGATKRLCEIYLTALDGDAGGRTRFKVVRFGNVLGSSGSVVPLLRKQAASGAPLTITDPGASRFFMTVAEAVGLVMLSLALDGRGAVFALDPGAPTRIADLAGDLVAALGLSPGEVPVRYVGLRPGEKLHETLWAAEEDVRPSPHGRIVSIRPAGLPRPEIEAIVDRLAALATAGSVGPLLEELRRAVPSWRPAAGDGAPCLAPREARR